MPRDLGGAAQRLAGLIAAVNQTLMQAAAAGREKLKLCRIPETRAQEIDASDIRRRSAEHSVCRTSLISRAGSGTSSLLGLAIGHLGVVGFDQLGAVCTPPTVGGLQAFDAAKPF